MQFITNLLGGNGNSYLTALFALGAVIAFIVIGLWLVKLIVRTSGAGPRGRNRRLAVVDSLMLDQKRHLLIVRRDDVEHLLLVGGSQDLVVESGIGAQALAHKKPALAENGTKAGGGDTRPIIAPASSVSTGPAPRSEPKIGDKSEDRAGDSAKGRSAARPLRHTGLLRPGAADDELADERVTHPQNSDISSDPGGDSGKQGQPMTATEGSGLDQETDTKARTS